LKEHGDKIPASDKEAIEQAISDLRGVMDGDDVDAITAKTEALGQASMKLGEAMYKASQAEAEAGPGPDSGSGEGTSAGESDEKVVDAEFEEVDPDKDKKAG
jgi:molecular chaperone DnaK